MASRAREIDTHPAGMQDRQADRPTDRQTETDGQTDRQTDRHRQTSSRTNAIADDLDKCTHAHACAHARTDTHTHTNTDVVLSALPDGSLKGCYSRCACQKLCAVMCLEPSCTHAHTHTHTRERMQVFPHLMCTLLRAFMQRSQPA